MGAAEHVKPQTTSAHFVEGDPAWRPLRSALTAARTMARGLIASHTCHAQTRRNLTASALVADTRVRTRSLRCSRPTRLSGGKATVATGDNTSVPEHSNGASGPNGNSDAML